jgi:FXSXX-COOH protein
MNEDADGQRGPRTRQSELIDVSTLPLTELLSVQNSALDNALRRILDDVDRSGEAISSWSSYLE